jgi:predicted  nucleic acid-binding Zn-ribbon protein
MSRILSRALVLVLMVAAALIGGSLVGRAQQPQPPPDVLTALLIEVRGLRAAMEQMASAGPRGQLALGRVQVQEQRIANQVRRLDTVTATIAALQKDLQPLEQRVKDLSKDPSGGPLDVDTQRMRDHEFETTKAAIAPMKAELQRLVTEQNLLAQDIDAEQNRWIDLNQRLEELDRALAVVRR